MSKKGQETAALIYEAVLPAGIKSFSMCSTRLRITLNDYSKIEVSKIAGFPGVINALVADDHLQVVMGVGDVVDVYSEFKKIAG